MKYNLFSTVTEKDILPQRTYNLLHTEKKNCKLIVGNFFHDAIRAIDKGNVRDYLRHAVKS